MTHMPEHIRNLVVRLGMSPADWFDREILPTCTVPDPMAHLCWDSNLKVTCLLAFRDPKKPVFELVADCVPYVAYGDADRTYHNCGFTAPFRKKPSKWLASYLWLTSRDRKLVYAYFIQ